MKQARQQKRAHGQAACGNCGRAVRMRGHAEGLACTTHLEVVHPNRAAECEDYTPGAASGQPAAAPVSED